MDIKHELKGNNQMRCQGKIFTGPKTDIFQVTIFHLFNLFLSIMFYSLTYNYHKLYHNKHFYFMELLSTILTANFALTCSFKDPGIVTQKTILFLDEEKAEIPDQVNKNTDFYEYFKKP